MSWNDFVEETSNHQNRKVKCHVCVLLEDLPEEGKAAVTEAMARPEIVSSAIRRALFNRGLRDGQVPSIWSLNRHRRNECRDLR